jgi:hypothetical protein
MVVAPAAAVVATIAETAAVATPSIMTLLEMFMLFLPLFTSEEVERVPMSAPAGLGPRAPERPSTVYVV